MARMSTEVKVGLFVMLGLCILIYMTATVGKWNLGQDTGYLVTVKLDSAAGLLKDSSVKVLGVTQGKVEALEIAGDKAKIYMRLPRALTLPEDSLVYLRSEGLLGENYIEIKPGSPQKPPVKHEGELLQGAPPTDIDQLLTELSTVATGINTLTRTITQPTDTAQEEKGKRGALQSIISNLEETSTSLKNLSERIERGEGTLGKLLTDETIYNQLTTTLSDIGVVFENLNSSEGTLVKLFQDEEIYESIKDTIARINAIIKKTEQGEGIAGKLLIDNRSYEDQTSEQEQTPNPSPEESTYVPLTALGSMLGKVPE
jgi:phospholipid/cholesterol/gamma-HCH transport system substrate-binding protein